jgi:hypothetical protein
LKLFLGDGAIDFFSNRIKISSKWPLIRTHQELQKKQEAVHNSVNGTLSSSSSSVPTAQAVTQDAANFAGSM